MAHVLLGQGTGAAPAQTPLASVEITGPTDLTVGAAATFTAEVTGLESWVWTLPSGRYVLDAPAITVTPEKTTVAPEVRMAVSSAAARSLPEATSSR